MNHSIVNSFCDSKNIVKLDTSYLNFIQEYKQSEEYNLYMFGQHLPHDAPAIFYIGNEANRIWDGLQQTNTRLISLSLDQSMMSYVELYRYANKALCHVFDEITTGGVYCVGHGFGALLIMKLLADKQTLETNARVKRLQAAFLLSGKYSITDADDLRRFQLESDIETCLQDNFDHLWPPGMRFYVFAGQQDDVAVRSQSRRMFDRLAESCDMCDMHFQIKSNTNERELLDEICSANNFLARLIRYDIGLSQTR